MNVQTPLHITSN